MSLPRRLLLLSCVLLALTSSGCWNYKEVDDMGIVAGVAVDLEPETGKLLLTLEMVDTKQSLEKSQSNSQMVSLSGDTLFEIVRNMISMTGKKLFWSHAKTIVLSKEVAQQSVVSIIDWFTRDTETRADVYIFISDEPTAREVLDREGTTDSVLSFELEQMMRQEKYTSTAPVVEIWDFIDKLESRGKMAIAPVIDLMEIGKEKTERVHGTAVFYRDKMVGKLNGDETKAMLFVKNEIRGGVLAVQNKLGKPEFSLEIYKNKTKIKPVGTADSLRLEIHTTTYTGLDEVMTTNGFTHPTSIEEIQELAEEQLEEEMKAVIQKMQQQYKTDIFGFGEYIHENKPKLWEEIKDEWNEMFTELPITVSSEIIIESTAKTSRSIRIGK